MVSLVQGDVEQTDRQRKKKKNRMRGHALDSKRPEQEMKSLFGIVLCFGNPFKYSDIVSRPSVSISVVMQGRVDPVTRRPLTGGSIHCCRITQISAVVYCILYIEILRSDGLESLLNLFRLFLS